MHPTFDISASLLLLLLNLVQVNGISLLMFFMVLPSLSRRRQAAKKQRRFLQNHLIPKMKKRILLKDV